LGAEKKGDQHPFAVCREGSHCKAVWCHVSLQGREVRVGWLCVCSRERGRGERKRKKGEKHREGGACVGAGVGAVCSAEKTRSEYTPRGSGSVYARGVAAVVVCGAWCVG